MYSRVVVSLSSSTPPPSDGAPDDAAAATARAILGDVAQNPAYYLNVSAVLVGLSLSAVVLSATVVALDSLPLVPDILRVVGLAYVFWFLTKFLFSPADRARLAADVDEFVDGVRGGTYTLLPAQTPLDTDMDMDMDVEKRIDMNRRQDEIEQQQSVTQNDGEKDSAK